MARDWAALVLLALLGCAGRPPRVAQPAPSSSRGGRTSVRLLSAANDASATDQDVTIVPAAATASNVLPEYPPAALAAGCTRGSVPVRLHVAIDGGVRAEIPAPGLTLQQDACHRAFAAAVNAALRTWRLVPSLRFDCPPPASQPCEGRPIAIYLDVAFDFDIVEGRGVVVPHQ